MLQAHLLLVNVIGWPVVVAVFCWAARDLRRQNRRNRMHYTIRQAERHLPPSQWSDLEYLERPQRRPSRRVR